MTENINTGVVSNEAAAPTNINNTSSNENTFDVTKYVTDDLRADPDFERLFKNIPNDPHKLVKDLYHKTKHFGKVRETVRGEIEAEMKKPVVYNADQYNYELPENYLIEDEILNTAKTKAAELGISPEAAKAFMGEIFKADSQIEARLAAENKAAQEKVIAELKSEWGVDYEKRLEKANNTWSRLTSPEDDALIENLPMNAKALLSKVMDKIGQKISEPLIGGLSSPASSKMTEQEFQSSLAAIDNDNMLTPNQKTTKKSEIYGKFYSKSDIQKEFGLAD